MSFHNHAPKSVQSPGAVPVNIIDQCVLPRATRTDCPAEDLQLGKRLTHFQEPHGLCRATVNKLTDDSLLDIFDFCLNDDGPDGFENSDAWQTLVHVCRRWRDIVFASPRRLNLRLLCGTRAPRRVIMLDIWPALPIEIYDDRCSMGVRFVITDILLKHSDRVCSIRLREFPSIAWQDLAAAIQAPFPELTYLSLRSDKYNEPVLPLPDSFLGGSAPRLRTLELLHGISFPALPNLLLSASDLVTLSISRLPYPKYVSPEAMLACLSSLTRLKSLVLPFGFITPSSLPGQPPQTRVVLPALTDLYFSGLHEHLEDFLSRIDTPVLNKFSMSFIFALRLVSDVPHLKQFIGRAKGLKPYKVARVAFKPRSIQLSLTKPLPLSLEMMCDMISSQLHTMSLICGRLSPFLSLVKRLYLTGDYQHSLPWQEDTVSSRFLELFQPFTAIRKLHVSEGLIPLIALALQRLVGERAAEVLPNLRDLFMEGPELPRTVQEAILPFLTARRLSGQPVAVRHWEGFTTDR